MSWYRRSGVCLRVEAALREISAGGVVGADWPGAVVEGLRAGAFGLGAVQGGGGGCCERACLWGEAEEGGRFLHRFCDGFQAAAMLDEVEKIAARGAGSVLPFACVGSVEADVNSSLPYRAGWSRRSTDRLPVCRVRGMPGRRLRRVRRGSRRARPRSAARGCGVWFAGRWPGCLGRPPRVGCLCCRSGYRGLCPGRCRLRLGAGRFWPCRIGWRRVRGRWGRALRARAGGRETSPDCGGRVRPR